MTSPRFSNSKVVLLPTLSLFWISSMFFLCLLWISIQSSVLVQGFNFPYTGIQLTDNDVKNYSTIAFGVPSSSARLTTSADCKVYPGDKQWPGDSEWKKLNDTLGGALIKGVPPAIVCYPATYNATQCDAVKAQYFIDQHRNDDPVSIVNEWLDGDSCPPESYTNDTLSDSTCNVAAYPPYVVNATTVKRKTSRTSVPTHGMPPNEPLTYQMETWQDLSTELQEVIITHSLITDHSTDIQLAVNFARNSNIRLNIKWVYNSRIQISFPRFENPKLALHLTRRIQKHRSWLAWPVSWCGIVEYLNSSFEGLWVLAIAKAQGT